MTTTQQLMHEVLTNQLHYEQQNPLSAGKAPLPKTAIATDGLNERRLNWAAARLDTFETYGRLT